MAGSETETAGVMGKLKETTGLEAEIVVGTEGGVDTEAGMDSESTADRSGAGAGAEVSASGLAIGGGGYRDQRQCGGGGKGTSWFNCGNDSAGECGGE